VLDGVSVGGYTGELGGDAMSDKLAETLRNVRGIKGAKLRDVEKATGISNAYLSQLETGKAENPSPHVLYKLAQYYGVPYKSLMEAAGYLVDEKPGAKKQRPGAIQAALMSAELTADEEAKVAEFIKFLRSQRRPGD
jgi:transcriptional regulator with XRE-family HTH domain